LFKDKPVLRKPFLISQFAAMINSALSDGPSPARMNGLLTLSPGQAASLEELSDPGS